MYFYYLGLGGYGHVYVVKKSTEKMEEDSEQAISDKQVCKIVPIEDRTKSAIEASKDVIQALEQHREVENIVK